MPTLVPGIRSLMSPPRVSLLPTPPAGRRLRLANLREHFDFEVVLTSEKNPDGGRPEVRYLLTLDGARASVVVDTPVTLGLLTSQRRVGGFRPSWPRRGRWPG